LPSIAVYKKEDIIDFVWKNRAGCVSESSYYKLINQMRNNFALVGLKAADIVTRPRIGVSLSLPLEPFKDNGRKQAKTPEIQCGKKTVDRLISRRVKNFPPKYAFWF
jgi:DNA-binding winged helix-turn-helix (wHTH) protein